MGFVMFLIMHCTDLTLRLRPGINWIAEQNNVTLITQNNAGSANDEGDNTSRWGARQAQCSTKKTGNKDLAQWILWSSGYNV